MMCWRREDEMNGCIKVVKEKSDKKCGVGMNYLHQENWPLIKLNWIGERKAKK